MGTKFHLRPESNEAWKIRLKGVYTSATYEGPLHDSCTKGELNSCILQFRGVYCTKYRHRLTQRVQASFGDHYTDFVTLGEALQVTSSFGYR